MKHDTPAYLSWRTARAQAIDALHRAEDRADFDRIIHHPRCQPISRDCRQGAHGACDGLVRPSDDPCLLLTSLCWCSCLHRAPAPRPVSLAKGPRYKWVQP